MKAKFKPKKETEVVRKCFTPENILLIPFSLVCNWNNPNVKLAKQIPTKKLLNVLTTNITGSLWEKYVFLHGICKINSHLGMLLQ